MKKLALLAIVVLAFSCKKESQEPFGKSAETAIEVQTPEALGKEIFEGKGNCVACHQVDQKIVGPSIKEIAKIYKEKNGIWLISLKAKAKPLLTQVNSL